MVSILISCIIYFSYVYRPFHITLRVNEDDPGGVNFLAKSKCVHLTKYI